MLLVLAVVGGCRRTKRYESRIQVTRSSAVRKDETGKVLWCLAA
jgi:hypothetical protein